MKRTMAGSEERPSKFRRIDTSNGTDEPVQGNSSSMDLLDKNSTVEFGHIQIEGEEREKSTVSQGDPPISKSKLKKLRKAEQWEAGKDYRKALRKEKHKEKQARKAKEREELKEKIAKGEVEKPKVVPKTGPRRPIQVPVSILLDCDFNDFMTEKEIISLGAQLTRSYSENRTNPYRTHFAISSWGGALRNRFETVLTNNHQSWKGVRFFEEDFEKAAAELDGLMRGSEGGKLVGALAPGSSDLTAAIVSPVSESAPETSLKSDGVGSEAQPEPKSVQTAENGVQIGIPQPDPATEVEPSGEANTAQKPEQPEDTEHVLLQPELEPSIVYLSSDSENTLSKLSPNTTYVIGGIVDKNRHKGLCYKRACERGIPTAKLPIGEFMTMQSRTVLTVNHVVEIMLKWLETGDWGEAFLKVIPKRKEARLKVASWKSQDQQGKANGDSESEDDDEGSVKILCEEASAKVKGDESKSPE